MYYWDRNFYTLFVKIATEGLGAIATVLLTA